MEGVEGGGYKVSNVRRNVVTKIKNVRTGGEGKGGPYLGHFVRT